MRLRDPHEHEPRSPQESSDAGDGPSDSDALRDEGAALLAAADQAINRALSQNSDQFLNQTRQMGGQ